MPATKKIIRPAVHVDELATVDEGFRLELVADDIGGGLGAILAAIVADDADESLWFEVDVNDRIVQIPLATVRDAVQAAAGDVHSEAWYDRNMPVQPEQGKPK